MDNQDNFKQNNYYVLVFDSIWENPLSSKPAYLAVFLYVLTHAYKRDKEFIFNNEKIVVKRGQWLGSMRKIAEHFGLSISSVQKICKYLKSEHIIEHQANTKFTLFTVLNYDRYQPKLNTEVNTKRTPRETKDKDNKDNIKEKENIIKEKEKEIIEWFNTQHQTRYKTIGVSEANLKFWLDKYSIEDIKQAIILIKAHDFWSDKMNPTILFRTKSPKGQPVDYIGQLLNQPKPSQKPTEQYGEFIKRLEIWKKYGKTK